MFGVIGYERKGPIKFVQCDGVKEGCNHNQKGKLGGIEIISLTGKEKKHGCQNDYGAQRMS